MGQNVNREKEVTVRIKKVAKCTNVEEESLQELEPWKGHQNTSFPLTGNVFLYIAKAWPVTQQDIRRLKTFQMRCL